jgi:hypothetical protein
MRPVSAPSRNGLAVYRGAGPHSIVSSRCGRKTLYVKVLLDIVEFGPIGMLPKLRFWL